MAPRWYLSSAIQKRQVLLRDQLVLAVQMLANTCRAGDNLAKGLMALETSVPFPLSREIERIVTDHRLSVPLSKAIERTKDILQLESFTTFALVMVTFDEHGGDITVVLDKIAKSLEERQRLDRKIESETANGRKVLRILAVFPFIFVIAFMFLFPEGTSKLFSTVAGQILTVVVIVLVFICVVWGQKIMRIE